MLSFAVECKATFTQEVFTADEEIVLKVFLRYSEVDCVCAPFSCVYKGVRALYGTATCTSMTSMTSTTAHTPYRM